MAARLVDPDRGDILGAWVCTSCNSRVVVRTRSRFVRPPANPDDRCSCSFCCFDLSGPHGTVRWEPVPSAAVLPFTRKED